MKLSNFEELEEIVSNLNDKKVLDIETDIFNNMGLNTNLDNIFNLNDSLVSVLRDGKIQKTMLYLAYSRKWENDKCGDFHIFYCEELREAKKTKNNQKYKRAFRLDNKFMVILKGDNNLRYSKNIALEPCQKCLDIFNNKYSTNKTKQDFKITDYTNKKLKIGSELHWVQNDLENVPKIYDYIWDNISNEFKFMRFYTCQNCHIRLKENKKFLNTHYDKSLLKLLCVGCHSLETNHQYIEKQSLYQEFINYKKELSL